MVDVTLALVGSGILVVLIAAFTMQRRKNEQATSSSRTRDTSSSSSGGSQDPPLVTDGGVDISDGSSSDNSDDSMVDIPITESEEDSEEDSPDLSNIEEALSSDMMGLQSLMPQNQQGQAMFNMGFQQRQQMGGQITMPPVLNQCPQPMMPVPQIPVAQIPVAIMPLPQASTPAQGSPQVELPEKIPKPKPLLLVVKQLEKPVKAFVAMSEAGDKDISKIMENSKRLAHKKDKERQHIQKLTKLLQETESILADLEKDNLSSKDKQELENKLNSKISKIEDKIEDIKQKQSEYEDLLTSEEKELIQVLKENEEALQDIDKTIKSLKVVSQAMEVISPFIQSAQEEHNLELAEEEIDKIEKFLEKTLENEMQLTEEIDELKLFEEQTEEVDEEEIQEIENTLEENDRIKEKLENLQKQGKISKKTYNNLIHQTNKMQEALNELGANIKQEEKLEEQIKQETNQEEDKIGQETNQDKEDLQEAEKENQKAEQMTEEKDAKKVKECPRCGSNNFSAGQCQNCSSWVIECVNCQTINTRYDSEGMYNVRCRNCDNLHVENWQDITSHYKPFMAEVPRPKYVQKHPYLDTIHADNSWWYVRKSQSNQEKQGFKIHVSAHPENAAKVIKNSVKALRNHKLEHKLAYNPDKLFYHQIKDKLIKKGNIGDSGNKDGTMGKTITIYPYTDPKFSSSGLHKVNNNYETTKLAIKLLAESLGDQLIYGGPEIQTEGEVPVKYNGKATRIWIRYDKIGGDNWVDGGGNKHGRKAGLKPTEIQGLKQIPDINKIID
jgi:hypothetical protein